MAGTHVRVRLASAGTVAGDFLQERPQARLACIEAGRRHTPHGLVVEHVGLMEGVQDREVKDLVEAWLARYGLPAVTLGAPFALRLPLPLARVTAEVAKMHTEDLGPSTPLGHVLHAAHCDLWIACPSALQAETLALDLRGRLPRSAANGVGVGEPAVSDLECWEALRLALDVSQPAFA